MTIGQFSQKVTGYVRALVRVQIYIHGVVLSVNIDVHSCNDVEIRVCVFRDGIHRHGDRKFVLLLRNEHGGLLNNSF